MTAGLGTYPAEWTLAGGTQVRCTGWAQGDMAGSGPGVAARRSAVVDLPWTVLHQVHGARVVVVEGPGGASGEAADASVAATKSTPIAVLTADCAPVALSSPEGVLAVAHAGWKGLRAGVVEATVQTMRRLGATRIEAVLGPCIHPCCYSFGESELLQMETKFGSSVRSEDRTGALALDLPATVRSALQASGVLLVGELPECTSCTDGFWSWRQSGTSRRQATVAWRE
jgi:YfiH family protein